MELEVQFEDERRVIEPPDELTIGRQADLSIDPENRRLHRVLLRFWWDGSWVLTNVGRFITVVAADIDGLSYARLAPGVTIPVPFANTALTFSAGSANYRIVTSTAAPGAADHELLEEEPTVERTENPALLRFNSEQMELLAALAAPRIGGPITTADLPGSSELAHHLGWSTSKLNRKLDRLCSKLHGAGLQGVSGPSGDNASERRLILANFAVESGLVAVEAGPEVDKG